MDKAKTDNYLRNGDTIRIKGDMLVKKIRDKNGKSLTILEAEDSSLIFRVKVNQDGDPFLSGQWCPNQKDTKGVTKRAPKLFVL